MGNRDGKARGPVPPRGPRRPGAPRACSETPPRRWEPAVLCPPPRKNKRHQENPKTCKNLSRLFGVVTITTKSARVNKGHVSLSSHTRREKERVPREGEQGTASSGARDGPSSNLFINLLPGSVLFPLYVYFPYQKMSQGVWCRSRNEYNQVELIE